VEEQQQQQQEQEQEVEEEEQEQEQEQQQQEQGQGQGREEEGLRHSLSIWSSILSSFTSSPLPMAAFSWLYARIEITFLSRAWANCERIAASRMSYIAKERANVVS
jgi:hypothetical protein